MLLLANRRLDHRKVWLLWPLTYLPDIDYFFGFHRATLSNIFVLLPFIAALAWYWLPKHRDMVKVEWLGIALIYLTSHMVMDAFSGGTVFFYPLSDYTYCYVAAIDVITATNTPVYYFEACSRSGIPTVSTVYPWLDVEDGAILAFLIPSALVAAIVSLRTPGSRRGKQAVDPPEKGHG